MKLDFKLLKKILEDIESRSNGFENIWLVPQNTLSEYSQEEIFYHCKILEDDGLIRGAVLSNPPNCIVESLTAEGHRVLEVMRENKIWKNIEEVAEKLGIESLKQIPSLAIKLLLGSSI